MRIVVNDIAASTGGAKTVLKDFYEFIRDYDNENEWVFLLSDYFFTETERIKIIVLPKVKKNKFKKLRFDFFSGKKFIAALNPDVVFSLQNIITFGLKVPQVVYVHQPLPFQKERKFSFLRHNEIHYSIYQHIIGSIIKLSIRKADKIIVQTKWMEQAVSETCKINADRIVRIRPNIINFQPDEEPQFESKRFFYPTSSALYKNNELIYEACDILGEKSIDYSFVITLPEPKKRKAHNIVFVDRIPYEEVINYYRKSTLVFPSYIETFGYPLAEARKIGATILASDCPFSRELLDGYVNAYFFDYRSAPQLADLMEKVADGTIKNCHLIEDEQFSNNSWEAVFYEVTNY